MEYSTPDCRLKTVRGNFYNGLTRQAAQKQGYDIKLFDKIDSLDGKQAGTLSLEDIINRRDTECGKNAAWGLVGVCATTLVALSGAWPLVLVGALASGSLFYKCEAEDAKTNQYR